MGLLASMILQDRQNRFEQERAAQQDAQSQTLIAGLLGQAPTAGGELGPEGVGPPAPAGLGGQGLLGDIGDPNRQATFAGGLLGQAQTRTAGSSLLQGVFSDQGAMDRQRSANAANMDRSMLSSNTQFAIAAASRERQQAQFERTFTQKAELARLTRQQSAQQGLLSKPQPGYARVPALDGLGFQDVMIQGGEPFKKAQGAAIETRQGVGMVDELLGMVIDAQGPEAFGERAGKAVGLQGQLLSKILQARGFGAPQAAEMEFLFRQIPDISELSSGVGFKAKGKLIGALMELRAEFERSFDMQRQLGGGSNIRELAEELGASPSDVAERARAAGLTQVPRPKAVGMFGGPGQALGGGLRTRGNLGR